MINFEALNAELLGSAETLVAGWLPMGKRRGHEWVCGSLAGDEGDSLSVNLTTGRWADFSGDEKGGDLISLYAAVHCVTQSEAAKKLGSDRFQTNGAGARIAQPSSAPVQSPDPEPEAHEPPAGGPPPPPPWPAAKFRHYKFGEPNTVWPYLDAAGAGILAVARYDPPGERKQIVPWTFVGGKWTAKAPPKPRPLYGLDRLSRFGVLPVLLVEGEKTADAAQRYFPTRPCMTWMGGVAGAAHADWAPLAGKTVDLWPDADDPGREAMAKIAAKLLALGCTLAVIDTAELTLNWDLADAETDAWPKAKLIEFAKAHKKPIGRPEPAPAPTTPATVERLQTSPRKGAQVLENDPGPDSVYNRWSRWNLELMSSGLPVINQANVMRAIDARRPELDLYHDEFEHRIMANGKEWSDPMTLNLTQWLQDQGGLRKLTKNIVRDAVECYAFQRPRNPVQNWLKDLTWDGTERLTQMMHRGFGSRYTEYTAAVGRCFMVGMVARVMRPGCKVDTMPIFEGPQGALKSTALAIIGGKHYSVVHESMKSKDFYLVINGKLLLEFAELHAFGKNQETIKGILSTSVDRYRSPYGAYAADYPRTGVFAGTTNHTDWNADETGARRFWPIACGSLDLEWLRKKREQLFAEALFRFNDNEPWWNVPIIEAEIQRDARRRIDPWEDAIAPYIAAKERVTTAELLITVLTIKLDQVNVEHQRRVGSILRALGWVRRQERKTDKTGGARFWTRKTAGEQ